MKYDVWPLRTVVATRDDYIPPNHSFGCSYACRRFETLSCGHTMVVKGSSPMAKRRHCRECGMEGK